MAAGSCGPGQFLTSSTAEKHFSSGFNHAYGGRNRFVFKADSSFVYYGAGPSVLLSKGRWQYNAAAKEIILKTDNSFKPVFKNPIDTIWLNWQLKTVKVLSKKKIKFEDIIYYIQ